MDVDPDVAQAEEGLPTATAMDSAEGIPSTEAAAALVEVSDSIAVKDEVTVKPEGAGIQQGQQVPAPESGTAATATASAKDEDKPHKEINKRTVALHTGYVGTGYKGRCHIGVDLSTPLCAMVSVVRGAYRPAQAARVPAEIYMEMLSCSQVQT